MRLLLESLPLLAGLCCVIAVCIRFKQHLSPISKSLLAWITINVVLLWIAQSSWWYTVSILNDSNGENWTDIVWTVFNTSVMGLYLTLLMRYFRK